ncbi:hypothetical protein TNCV_872261 [Trichonephila clavipes]|nr:hypothetical protein TNCV_872261 [Trichonephila clavipes]
MYVREVLQTEVVSFLQDIPGAIFQQDNAHPHAAKTVRDFCSAQHRTVTAGSDVVQSGRPIFDDFFQHL